jgi:restriction system protein
MARKILNNQLPTSQALIIPTLKALHLLGGSGTNQEINQTVYEIEKLSEELLNIPHRENGLESEIDYRLAWSRTYLKKAGFIENSARGVWSRTSHEFDIDQIRKEDVVKKVQSILKNTEPKEKKLKNNVNQETDILQEDNEIDSWKEQLLSTLLTMQPGAFEKLAQRLLRECGFMKVEVTGKSGDGGIDGEGIAKINEFLTFRVIFQCKRYQKPITSSQIRDFRGAMQGRTDKGLFITTSSFTRDAIKEATRDGVPVIDLIDGESLCDKLKDLKLGIEIELIEKISIDTKWFENFDKF